MSTHWLNLCIRTWGVFAQAAPVAPPPGVPAAPAGGGMPQAPAGAPMPAPPGPVPVDASQVVNGAAAVAGGGHEMTLVHGLALFVHIVICLGLILCVMYRNTKSEGLGAVFSGGGGSSAAFRGKQSSDEMLGMWTGRLAVGFIVSSFLLWVFFYRS